MQVTLPKKKKNTQTCLMAELLAYCSKNKQYVKRGSKIEKGLLVKGGWYRHEALKFSGRVRGNVSIV